MYTVLDFEFNQAFDFPNDPTQLNPACRFEIIQIGAVRLDKDFNEEERFSTFIRPQIYKRMHPYVSKMTGITEKDFKNAPYFKEAYEIFKNFVGESRIYCVWGNSDIRALYRNLCYHGLISGEAVAEYIDVQQLTARYLKYGKGRNVGLKNAMEILGIETDIPFHDALGDAVYTARALKSVYTQNDGVRVFNSKHIPKRTDIRFAKRSKKEDKGGE